MIRESILIIMLMIILTQAQYNVNDDLNDDFVKDVFDFNVSDNLYDNFDSDVNDDLNDNFDSYVNDDLNNNFDSNVNDNLDDNLILMLMTI